MYLINFLNMVDSSGKKINEKTYNIVLGDNERNQRIRNVEFLRQSIQSFLNI